MINFIIVTHGEFGAYLVEAAESIVGRQARGVRVLSISSRVGVPEIRERIKRAVSDLSTDQGIIMFTDIPGGTPSNLSFPLIKDKEGIEVISGVNLYMLISAFSHRAEYGLKELVEKVVADGQKSICDIRQMFLSKCR